jgi:hypothetical protein
VSRGALLHGSADGLHQPHPHLSSCNPDGDRTSQLQHAVKDMDGNANFGGAAAVFGLCFTLCGTRAMLPVRSRGCIR